VEENWLSAKIFQPKRQVESTCLLLFYFASEHQALPAAMPIRRAGAQGTGSSRQP
jgi:hypothetical protein